MFVSVTSIGKILILSAGNMPELIIYSSLLSRLLKYAFTLSMTFSSAVTTNGFLMFALVMSSVLYVSAILSANSIT